MLDRIIRFSKVKAVPEIKLNRRIFWIMKS